MDLKMLKTVARTVIVLAMVLMGALMPVKTAEARSVTKAEQLVFYSNYYEITKQAAEDHDMSGTENLGMAQFAWESHYGTGPFTDRYNNISGVGCWPDTPGGPVVCHEVGHYSSKEECINAYYDLLADEYGFRGWHNDLAILEKMGGTYSGHSPKYVANITGMIATAKRLEADYLASAEVQERLEKERKAEMMAKLADEEIYVASEKAKPDAKVAGATAAMLPPTKMKGMTVATAAQMLIDGEMGTADEQRAALGSNYAKVQEYRTYISLPGQS